MTEILVGFLIAAGVGLTGVGAGSLLAPVLMLFFKVQPAEAVGTSLAFSAVTKLDGHARVHHSQADPLSHFAAPLPAVAFRAFCAVSSPWVCWMPNTTGTFCS